MDATKMRIPISAALLTLAAANAFGQSGHVHPQSAKPASDSARMAVMADHAMGGPMYTMPKNAKLERLNDRVPLSMARWHKHVNWCLPKKGDEARWLERKNDAPLFGPEGPIATKADCDAVNGEFHPNLFGWMVHVNAYEGTDLGAIFADDHRK